MAAADLSPFSPQGIGQQAAHEGQPLSFLCEVGKPFEKELRPGNLCRGECGTEYQRTHTVDQVLADDTAADNVSSHRGQCLTESADQKVYFGDAILFFRDPQPVTAAYADGMCFVYVEADVGVTLFQFHQPAEVCHVAIHAEDAFGDDKDLFEPGGILHQQRLQLLVIVVAIPLKRCPAKQYAVDDAGVN